jgi:hypothetical protein
MSGTRIYNIWAVMKRRCTNPNNKEFGRYGARGITICDEWQDFMSFYKWAIENNYTEELTLDRIDNNGNYEPSNCRWVTMKEQQRNRSNNHLITYEGKTLTISQWAEERNINHDTLFSRINKRHWEIGRALEYE